MFLIFLVPSEGPHHFEYRIISPDSVYIEWSEISEEHHNGNLLGFRISYRPECSDEGSSTQIDVNLWTRSYTITGLLPGSRYDILIAGYTAKGVGRERHIYFTTCKYLVAWTAFRLTRTLKGLKAPGP